MDHRGYMRAYIIFMVTFVVDNILLLTNYAYGKSKSNGSDNAMIKVVITKKCLDSECLI